MALMGLPRRWVRLISYAGSFFFFAVLLLLLANKNRVIHLNDYFPADLMPLYFQPLSGSFLVDISINKCFKVFRKEPSCALRQSYEGEGGDVGASGGWQVIEKDLVLGLSLFFPRYIAIKKVQAEYLEEHGGNVVLDIAVSSASDALIKGNSQRIPESVLKELHLQRVFDADEHTRLQDFNKDEPLDANTDKNKAASANANKAKEAHDQAQAVAETVDENSKFVQNTESPEIKRIERRTQETSRHKLKGYYKIPDSDELKVLGWVDKGHGIWVKYGPHTANAVTGVDVLFGPDAIDPRPNWTILPNPLSGTGAQNGVLPYLSIRKGPKLDYKSSTYQRPVKAKNGKFKILQVADLHFSTGVGKCRDPVPASSAANCEADPRTLEFLNKVLDLEQPDFVVMTGDQVFGQGAPDPATALFKAVYPFVQRKIPYAITLGNHDDESVLLREQMMALAAALPFSVASTGPVGVDGYGNYALPVQGTSAALFFMDSHSYSKMPKTNPGYDWFKESQVEWITSEAEKLDKPLGMAFFHIPIPEFKDRFENEEIIGEHREGITAPRYNSHMRSAFTKANIMVASVGHDHANDYCLRDKHKDDTGENRMWLCYGGGVGEGGYGGYGGYVRRLRVFELETSTRTVRTWKRRQDEPEKIFDEQAVVSEGRLV